MKILGNPVLGKILNKYALLLNQEGLYRRIRLKGSKDYTIFLTDNPKDICKLFDLDFDILDKLQEIEALKYIKTSDYFTASPFSHTSKSPSKDISKMMDIITDEDKKKDTQPIDTKRVMDILGNDKLLDTINYYKDVLPKAIKSSKGKFQELKKALIKSGYNPQNFSSDLPKFKRSFENRFEYSIFLYENDIETLLERYKNS